MRNIIRVFSTLIFLAGFVFFLQGINILPGSYMTGDPQWAINGAVMMAVSIGLFWFAGRKR